MSYTQFASQTIRVHLDIYIGGLGIELVPILNQTNIGNGMQYQISCLDTYKIATVNLRTSRLSTLNSTAPPSHSSTEREKGREGSGFAGRRCSKTGCTAGLAGEGGRREGRPRGSPRREAGEGHRAVNRGGAARGSLRREAGEGRRAARRAGRQGRGAGVRITGVSDPRGGGGE